MDNEENTLPEPELGNSRHTESPSPPERGRDFDHGRRRPDSVSPQRDESNHTSGPASGDEPTIVPREAERVVPAELIEAVEEEARDTALGVLRSASFSGPLPMAGDLHEYSENEAERILRMAEAFTSDESKRRDVMVASATKVAERSQILTPIMLVVAFGFSLGSYALFSNIILSGFFLSIPVLKVVGSSITSAVRKRKADNEDDE